MRIGMILDTEKGYPPDIRVDKETKALTSAGHELYILTRRVQEISSVIEFLHATSTTVVRKISPRNSNNLWALIQTIFLESSRWIESIRWFIQKYHLEVLHVHDLMLVPAALKAAKRYRIPIVADLHENMPAAKRAYRLGYPIVKRMVHGLLWNYNLMRLKEASSLRKCIRVIVVVPEAAERIYKYGIDPNRIVIVSNTEDETTFMCDPSSLDMQIANNLKNYWTASYIGGIDLHRGIDTALRAVPKVISAIDNFRLLIVGANDKDKSWINSEANKLGVRQAVQIVSWQPFEKVINYILASKVCLVPYNDFEHTQTTIPHKLFQYMICNKPVLVSDCRPLARVVSQAKSGRIFKANNSDSLAEELTWMYRHPEEIEMMGRNGRIAALGVFSWKNDANRLVNMYLDVEKEIQKRYMR